MSLPEGLDLLPRGLVVEQVLQVSQSQLWFGLHRLLNTHLPAAALFLLRVDKQYNTNAFSFNPGCWRPGRLSTGLTPCLGRACVSQSVMSSRMLAAWPQLHTQSSSWL